VFPALTEEEFFESEDISIEEIFQDLQPTRNKSPDIIGAAALFGNTYLEISKIRAEKIRDLNA
jgi:hypothetical protein